jgi:hypothetical protein
MVVRIDENGTRGGGRGGLMIYEQIIDLHQLSLARIRDRFSSSQTDNTDSYYL